MACTAAGVKYSLSAKLQYSYSTPAGNVVQNATGTIAGTSSSNPIVKYVPLTITSSAATPSPFQQMVIVNMNNYNSYASSNLSNIEFTYPNGTIIPSWRENGTSNSQTVLYWLKLGSFTTTTVDMDFFSTSSNVLNTVNTGEAPQIPCGSTPTSSCSNYAEYDNGANVFSFYDNFAGTSLNINKWSETINGGLTITVNNGLTMTQTGGTYNDQGIIGKTGVSVPTIIESYGKIAQDQNTGYDMSAFGILNSLSPSNLLAIGTGNSVGNIYLVPTNDGPLTNYNSYATSNEIWSVWYNGSLTTSQMNYGDIYTHPYSITSTLYPAFYLESYGNSEYFSQWVRTRAYPPNGVMPSVTFGSVA